MLTIEKLRELKTILKLSQIAKEAGLKENTLTLKVSFQRELNVKESERIEQVLNSYGLFLKE